LFVVSAFGATDRASEFFETARAAFTAGNYSAALEAFEAAAKAGMTGPALQFNIGVCAWRTGQYERAEAAFQQAAREPGMAALAHYNLGLVALSRNDRGDARKWFQQAEREASDERVRTLATARLTELGPEEVQRAWTGYAAVGVGYDDNVALISTADIPGASNQGDDFMDVQLALGVPVAQSWYLDADAFFIRYHDLSAFDQWGVQGAGRYRFDYANWSNEAALEVAYSTFDDNGFESRRSLAFKASRQMREDLALRAQYRYSDVDGLGEFGGLTGVRHEAGVRGEWLRAPWRTALEYRFDLGDYRDDALSAVRHQLAVDVRRELPRDWELGLILSERYSDYDDEAVGNERRTELALGASRWLTQRWRLNCRAAYSDSDSTRDELDYERYRFSVNVDAVF
jgi:tetratricopeptide (TPR) repeat protein